MKIKVDGEAFETLAMLHGTWRNLDGAANAAAKACYAEVYRLAGVTPEELDKNGQFLTFDTAGEADGYYEITIQACPCCGGRDVTVN